MIVLGSSEEVLGTVRDTVIRDCGSFFSFYICRKGGTVT